MAKRVAEVEGAAGQDTRAAGDRIGEVASTECRNRELRNRHEGRPVEWVREVLHEELWSTQRAILRSVVANRYTAVKSCHGSGKSHLASRAIAHFLDQHPPGTAFVVSTAPTWPQVRAVVWRYIGKAHAKGKLAGRVNQTEWHMDPLGTHRTAPHPTEEIVAYGRKPADTSPEGFQGIHPVRVSCSMLVAATPVAGAAPVTRQDGC